MGRYRTLAVQATGRRCAAYSLGPQAPFCRRPSAVLNQRSSRMRFEKLVVWHRATDLSVSLYRRLAELRDYGFRDQITR